MADLALGVLVEPDASESVGLSQVTQTDGAATLDSPFERQGLAVLLTDTAVTFVARSVAARSAIGGRERSVQYDGIIAVEAARGVALVTTRTGSIKMRYDARAQDDVDRLILELNKRRRLFVADGLNAHSGPREFEIKSHLITVDEAGVTVTGKTALARGALGRATIQITFDDLMTVELGTANAKLRAGRTAIIIPFQKPESDTVRQAMDTIVAHHTLATGRSLGTPARLAKADRATAISDGFAHALETRLPEIAEAMRQRDITLEGRLTFELAKWAKSQPVKRGDETARDRLRRLREELGLHPLEIVGSLKPATLSAHMAAKRKLVAFKVGKQIDVYEDRIIQGSIAHAIDSITQAQIYLDGQTQVTTRPTLTRAALLSPLPGSALLPSLALAKKEKIDSREAEFQVGSVGWTLTVPLEPDLLSEPRSIANRINAIANTIQDRGEERSAPLPTQPAYDIVAQIERIVALQDSGAITTEQAEIMKSKLIAG